MCRQYKDYIRACAATGHRGEKINVGVAKWNSRHNHLLFGRLAVKHDLHLVKPHAPWCASRNEDICDCGGWQPKNTTHQTVRGEVCPSCGGLGIDNPRFDSPPCRDCDGTGISNGRR